MAFPGSTLARHQLASFAATVVDFGTMALLVELLALPPALATLVSATLGAGVNFTLSRRHVFERARRGSVRAQGARYALVSASSALLNATGELVGTRVFGAAYLPVRVVVAFFVGIGFNYPLHRGFVFRSPAEPA